MYVVFDKEYGIALTYINIKFGWYTSTFLRLVRSAYYYDLCRLSDMTFMHEGNQTYFENLVNFEKMVSG